MNKKQISYIIVMLILTAVILLSDKINPIDKPYEINNQMAALQLFCQLILPCILGSIIAQVSAQWIKAEGFATFKKHKHLIYIVIELLAAYILFMLYPIFSIMIGTSMPTAIGEYMLFAAENLYLYIIIYFLLTLGIIKACRS